LKWKKDKKFGKFKKKIQKKKKKKPNPTLSVVEKETG